MNDELRGKRAWLGVAKQVTQGTPTGRSWHIVTRVDGKVVSKSYCWLEGLLDSAITAQALGAGGAWIDWHRPVRDEVNGIVWLDGHTNRRHPAYWRHLAAVAWERMWAWLPYRITIERKRQNHDEDE